MSNVINLIRKDFVLFQKYIWIVLIYLLIFSNNGLTSGMIPGIVVVLIVGMELKASNQQFLLTLPLNRRLLIIAKYISSIFYALCGLILSVLVSIGFDYFRNGSYSFSITETSIMLFIVIFLTSVYLPLSYWLGFKGTQYLNIVVIIVILSMSSIVSNIIADPDSSSVILWIADHQAGSVMFAGAASLLLLVISYFISFTIFTKKDF